MPRLFGTDGVRGVANEDLPPELAFSLGRAVVLTLRSRGENRPSVAVGRDTRASGEFLEAALVAGVCSAGGDALLLGVCTSPAVAHLTRDLGAAAGAVVSASHNPARDNGIKFFDASGYKFSEELEDDVEAFIGDERQPRPTGLDIGRVRAIGDANERYLRHLERVPGMRLAGMRLVVDCANGAASGVAPELYRRLGADVVAIHDSPDGWNINDRCGATCPDVVARAVIERHADAGVAHDGDADRAMFADERGEVLDGDPVLAACALDLKQRGELDNDLLVTTVMANLGLRLRMRDAGIEVIETNVGDRYVLEEMRRTGAALGGEQSGHVIFARHATTGDGLLTAAQFLSLACAEGRAVSQVAAVMQKFPQVLENVRVADRNGLERAERVWDAVRSAEAALGEGGRILVRASGTEPLVRVMVEAPTEQAARAHAGAIADAVREELGG